jgi:glycosyltransferase involved in cell wall biosynthesis
MRDYCLLLRGLAEVGWQVTLLTRATSQNEGLTRLWSLVELFKVPSEGLIGMARFLKAVLLSEADVLWGMVWGWIGWALLLRRLIRGTPYVLWLDGYSHLAPWDVTNWRKRLLMELRYGLVLRGASRVFSEAAENLAHNKRTLPDANIQLLSPSLWIKDLMQVEAQWGGGGIAREPLILYSGRILEHKQVHMLIEAFTAVASEFPQWRLEIRGSRPDGAYFERLERIVADHALDGRVVFCPAVSGEALYRRFRACSVFCLPSRLEGFPTTILEAMFFGGAIIAARAGWIGYQLEGGCGLVYPSDDIHTLREHLVATMSSPQLRATLMIKAKKRMVDQFSWESKFEGVETDLFNLSQVVCRHD